MEVSRHWRLQGQRYNLTGTACTRCGKQFFTPRPVCDECSAPTADLYTFETRRTRREYSPVVEPAQR